MAPKDQDWVDEITLEEGKENILEIIMQPNQFCQTCWYWLGLIVNGVDEVYRLRSGLTWSLTRLTSKHCMEVLRLHPHVSFTISYSKCGLCLKDLEVIRPASGLPYIRCVDWKLCPFFRIVHAWLSAMPDRSCNTRLQSTWKRTVYYLQTHGRFKTSEESIPTHSSNGLMNYLWMFRKHNLQCIALKKTSPHNWTQSNAFQDQGCKDNLPIRKTGILEHSTCLLYYWTLIHFLIYVILVRIILYLQ